MSCPTCAETLQRIGSAIYGEPIFMCPRCGTIKVEPGGGSENVVYVPKLVERCQEFERIECLPGSSLRLLWERRGIGEAIHLPE